ncbi:MAG: hypothetical protein IPK60_11155 [Sandaracinaceae bacterium]|nr:hypothetical protein [Sandaracinaceae bacterium]
MKRLLISFGWDALFGTGLLISGMTLPAKVQGFLDVAGNWDPSLAFVMGAALAVFIPLRILIERRGGVHETLARGHYDVRLLGGAALFGAGWGLGGYCPGPSVVSAGAGALPAIIVLAGTLAGIWLADRTRGSAPLSIAPPASPDACAP